MKRILIEKLGVLDKNSTLILPNKVEGVPGVFAVHKDFDHGQKPYGIVEVVQEGDELVAYSNLELPDNKQLSIGFLSRFNEFNSDKVMVHHFIKLVSIGLVNKF